jgi:hypothetical protein
MKIRSNIELPYDANRGGIKRAIIEIDLRITNKDDVSKIYTLLATDYAIDLSLDQRMYIQGRMMIFNKEYTKTYDEYDSQREYLLSIDTSGLDGSVLDDKLLQDALLYSAMTDCVYESTSDDWVVYSDPIIEQTLQYNNTAAPLPPAEETTSTTTAAPATSTTTAAPATSTTTAAPATSTTTAAPTTSTTTAAPATSTTTAAPTTSTTTAAPATSTTTKVPT